MIRFRLEIDGEEDFLRQVDADEKRFEEMEDLLLDVLGQALASRMQENIKSRGQRLADRGISWPALAPETVRIREHYGHPGSDPRLIRGGDLLRSIQVLGKGDGYVEAGSLLEAGAAVHFGGEITDSRGQRRTIQAFPWALPSEQDLSDFMTTILDVVSGEDAA